MKFFRKLLVPVAILSFAFTSSLSAKETSILQPSPTSMPSSYELFYPVVAGRIPGDNLYQIKLLREWFVDKLLFDKIKRSDYHLILSKKRLVETEALLKKKAESQIVKTTLDKAVNEVNKSIQFAQDAQKQGKQTKDLFNTIRAVINIEADFIEKSFGNPFVSAASNLRNLLPSINNQ